MSWYAFGFGRWLGQYVSALLSPRRVFPPTPLHALALAAAFVLVSSGAGFAQTINQNLWVTNGDVQAVVRAGTRYGYRLGVMEAGHDVFLGETWVDVPATLGLALAFRSNPAREDLGVSLEREPDWAALPAQTPARVRDLLHQDTEECDLLRSWGEATARSAGAARARTDQTPQPDAGGGAGEHRGRAGLATLSEESSQRRLAKVPVDGGSPPVGLIDWDDDWNTSIVWLEDGDLLITSNSGTRFFRLPSGGGPAKPAIKLDTGPVSGELSLGLPLPGDRGVFCSLGSWGPGGYQVDTWILDPGSGKARRLFELRAARVVSFTTCGVRPSEASSGLACRSVSRCS